METTPENVLLIVVDSLRADRLSCYGYGKETSPFIDSVAERSLKFDHAYSTAPWTVPVHGSLFSGELPSYHGSHRKSKTFKKSPDQSLAGILSRGGYTTAGFSANPWLTPEFDFDTGFDYYEYLSPQPPFPDDAIHPEYNDANLSSMSGILNILSWVTDGNPIKRVSNQFWTRFFGKSFVSASHVTDAIVSHLDTSSEQNNFIFANYMDVHDPHYDTIFEHRDLEKPQKNAPASIRAKNHTYPFIEERIDFQSEPENPERARTLYDQSVREVDTGIRRLFNNLSEQINLEESLTIILGDHGECLGEHGYWGHGTYLHEELLRVPLIIDLPKYSSYEPVSQDSPVSLLSLFDFIITMANETAEDSWKSITSLVDEEPLSAECTGPRPNMEGKASKTGYRTVIDAGWKITRNIDTNELSLTQMTDLPSDMETRQEAKRHLKDLEQNRWEGKEADAIDGDGSISSTTKSRLSDLGYL